VDFEEWAEPATRDGFRAAIEVLRGMGVQLVEAKLADLPYGAVTGTVISAEGASVFEPLMQSGQVDQLADKKQIAGLRAGLEIPARDYLKAMRLRTLIRQEFRRVLTDVDVILAPSRYSVASKIGDPLDRDTLAGRPAPALPGCAR
jgi:Asp-tRNAAsn/Glu-tRNAGln amidotransferase A subunit and related amidases